MSRLMVEPVGCTTYADRMNIGCDRVVHELDVATRDLDKIDADIDHLKNRINQISTINGAAAERLIVELKELTNLRDTLEKNVLRMENDITRQILSSAHLICI